MNISDFDYPLPDERIAKFPLGERDSSRLLVWRRGDISETCFRNIASVLPPGSLLVFNNTRVVRARLVMHKSSGARIEILCLEPHDPADYERAFAAKDSCEWVCMVGNSKKWKDGALECDELRAYRQAENIVRFEWESDLSFSELLEHLGRVPIPPYLGRDSEEIDHVRYQTVYSRIEGSVAAPTAGLHFTPELLERLERQDEKGSATGAPLSQKIEFDEVTLHVGAGTFLPVKAENALDHPMHTEHFEVTLATVEHLMAKRGKIIAVGTTSVRTLESLAALAYRIVQTGGVGVGSPGIETPVGQFEPYYIPAEFDGEAALQTLADHMRAHGLQKIAASTRIMITPGLPTSQDASYTRGDGRRPVDETFSFRIVDGIVTNFHQPKSTLLLLISAFTGGGEWRRIYDYALAHDFRFLSYGDSSLLLR